MLRLFCGRHSGDSLTFYEDFEEMETEEKKLDNFLEDRSYWNAILNKSVSREMCLNNLLILMVLFIIDQFSPSRIIVINNNCTVKALYDGPVKFGTFWSA
jgi:hypothetical protein